MLKMFDLLKDADKQISEIEESAKEDIVYILKDYIESIIENLDYEDNFLNKIYYIIIDNDSNLLDILIAWNNLKKEFVL